MVGGRKVDDGCVRCWAGESCAACVELRCGKRERKKGGSSKTKLLRAALLGGLQGLRKVDELSRVRGEW